MLNNKGFAVSIILYSISTVILLVLLLILAVNATNVHNNDKMVNDIKLQFALETPVGDSDTIAPTVTVSISGDIAIFTLTDNVGVTAYGVNQSNTVEPSYTIISSTINTTITWTASEYGTYYVWVKDNAGNTTKTLFIISQTVKDKILADNTLVTIPPSLATANNDTSGLYKSTATNDGSPTYYFRGNVENNYVSFAGFTWRIVRINEDGTIRMIMADGINDNTTYKFSSSANSYTNMYYTNSNAKTQLESWYQINIASNTIYLNKVASGNYFCEQYKDVNNASYMPNFRCSNDENGYGLVNASIGLITYDEVVYAGAYLEESNRNYYLYNNRDYWTMSPTGFIYDIASEYLVADYIAFFDVDYAYYLRPVVNLKADTVMTGSGTSTDPYVVQS